MNSILIGHAFCHLLAQIRCCSCKSEIKHDMLTECIWCVCRVITYNAGDSVFNEEELDNIRTYLIDHKVYEIANNRWYAVITLLYALCKVLDISEEQGISALQATYNDVIADHAETLADNIYRLYLSNNKE